MTPYRVFKQHRGVLTYEATSTALGSGTFEVAYIVDAHKLNPGDVIWLGNDFVLIETVDPVLTLSDPPRVNYTYLPQWEDHDYLFRDGPWSLAMIARLQREAQVCKEMNKR